MVAEVELVGDVAADEVGGRGRQGDARGRADLPAGQADPGVVGPEVVAPLADAVRLVDRQQGRADPGHRLDEPGAPEPLGGDIDEVIPAGLDLREPGALLGGVERAVEQGRPQASLDQGVDLVLHQGDQRADDQGQAGQEEGRQLVAEALAAAGRHDAEHIPPAQDVLDHLALARPESLQAEPLAERLFQVDRRVGDAHRGSGPVAFFEGTPHYTKPFPSPRPVRSARLTGVRQGLRLASSRVVPSGDPRIPPLMEPTR